MLDEQPATRLRIRPEDLARRAALEQRKLREMISFCYTEDCYRAFILDYFGDRSHESAAARAATAVCARSPRDFADSDDVLTGAAAEATPVRQSSPRATSTAS
jgi:superfamily II DNA helicase RecQ